MFSDIQAAIPLGFFLSFMVGPVFFVLLETSVLKGFRAALCFNIGVIVADIVFISIAYYTSYQLIEMLSRQPIFYVFGATVLIAYGCFVFYSKPKVVVYNSVHKTTKSGYVTLAIKGFFLNFINIGVLVFWLGLIVVVAPNLDNEVGRIRSFFALLLLTYFLTDMVKIILAKQLRKKLTEYRTRKLKKLMAAVLVICGVVLLLRGFL